MEKRTTDLLRELASTEVQQYIREHERDDVNDLLLKDRTIAGVEMRYIAEQIASRRKAKDKLPIFYRTAGVVYPPSASLEQSSSQSTALYKSGIARTLTVGRQGTTRVIADLTGGLGVDSYFLAQQFHTVHYVEPQDFLAEIARHNHGVLGANNIEYHQRTAEEFLKQATYFDMVYIDPSRRTTANRKVSAFEDCQPDVVKLQDTILEKTPFMLIKASPLLDIQAGMRQLRHVQTVHVVAVNNECKELLFVCDRTFSGDAVVEAIDLSDPNEAFRFSFQQEKAEDVSFGNPMQFLYEPNAAIMKAGAFKLVARQFQVKKIAPNTHLYTSDKLVAGFPGRTFRIEGLIKADREALSKHFPNGNANVTTRNYPLAAAELKKKVGLQDGGEKFLFGFSGIAKKFLAVAVRVES
ncbi:MAG TPA: SAM-dependent methyltransferase [Chryseosolibacter sp.]|nr:SAM-dependent methyltransferase [Chryseosolibacter sp.]